MSTIANTSSSTDTFGTLVHVARLNVEEDYNEAFGRWFETEYVPALLTRPGWLHVSHYECLLGEPRWLVLHAITEEAIDDLLSAAPFRAPAFTDRIRDYTAHTYREIHQQGEDPARSELINLITVDVEPDHAESFSRWYNEVHVPEIVGCPGWRGARRYASISDPGRFMTVYGLDDAERPFSTPEYEDATGWDEHVDHIRGYHGWRIYRLVTRIGR